MIIYNWFLWTINLLPILSFLLSGMALMLSYYALMTNSEPLFVFIWDDNYQCYYLKNVGKGPAINIIVTYTDEPKPSYWINPVKCYSLESNGKFYIDWGLTDGGNLFKKGTNEEFKKFLDGVPKIGAVYSSASFLHKQTYTSVCENENTDTKKGNTIKR